MCLALSSQYAQSVCGCCTQKEGVTLWAQLLGSRTKSRNMLAHLASEPSQEWRSFCSISGTAAGTGMALKLPTIGCSCPPTTQACQPTCLALRSQEAISWQASVQMSNWLLAKDQRQHCCPTCCLGFKTDAELFLHLKHTEVHKVKQISQACCHNHAL